MRITFVPERRHALGSRTFDRLRPWACARNGPRYWTHWAWWAAWRGSSAWQHVPVTESGRLA